MPPLASILKPFRRGRVRTYGDRHNVYREFRPVCEALEIHFPHMARHWFGSRLNALNTKTRNIMSAGSWTSEKGITPYTKTDLERGREVVSRLSISYRHKSSTNKPFSTTLFGIKKEEVTYMPIKFLIAGVLVFAAGSTAGQAQSLPQAGCGGGNFKCDGPFNPSAPPPTPGGGNWKPGSNLFYWLQESDEFHWLQDGFSKQDGRIGGLSDYLYVLKTQKGYAILPSQDPIIPDFNLSPTNEQLRQLQKELSVHQFEQAK